MGSESQPPPKRRSTVYEPSFEEARQRIEPDCKRFDDLTAGAQWRIEENADSCPVAYPADGHAPEIRMSRAQEAPGTDIIRIFFTVDESEVCHLIDVDVVPDPLVPLDDDDESA